MAFTNNGFIHIIFMSERQSIKDNNIVSKFKKKERETHILVNCLPDLPNYKGLHFYYAIEGEKVIRITIFFFE